jgi:predicted AAA+ superfamily ATPase
MFNRETYLEKIRPFIGTDLIKVLTGVRRCGKSVMLELLKTELTERGVRPERMLHVNFEDIANKRWLDGDALHARVLECAGDSQEKFACFFDEVQLLPKWETYINSLRLRRNIDIYVTGSNAKLLSGELATLLTGRYIAFEIQPFSFPEFLELHRSIRGEKPVAEVFNDYVIFGGMPFLSNLGLDYATSMQYLRDIYQTILMKDVLQRHNIRDADLLERIVIYVLSNVGKTFSALSISKYLKSEKRIVSSETVLNYLRTCEEAFLFSRVRRNDLNGKKLLTINEKFYVCDHGFREALCRGNVNSIEIVLENMVYQELRRRGWTVTIGKVGDLEIDFVAEKQKQLCYVQVAYILADDNVIAREFGAFDKLDSHFPKYVLSMDEFDRSHEGIKHLNIRDFLLGKELV